MNLPRMGHFHLIDDVQPLIPITIGRTILSAGQPYVGWTQSVRMCGVPRQLIQQIRDGATVGQTIVCHAPPGIRYSTTRRPRQRRPFSDIIQLWQLVRSADDPYQAIVEFVAWGETRSHSERRLRRRKWRQKRRKRAF